MAPRSDESLRHDVWAPWVTRIRRRLEPYRRRIAAVLMVPMLILFLGSFRTELWRPISDNPKKAQSLALIIGLIAYVLVFPTEEEVTEERSRKLRVIEGLLREWNPLGALGQRTSVPSDEYDSYAPRILSMVKSGCTVEELASHMEFLATKAIGVGSRPSLNAAFAARIVAALRRQPEEPHG